jgi:antibiotic biosynthesis monooxygenase (ABM) superfamily enzyme
MRTPTPLYPPLTQLQPLRPAARARPVPRASSSAARTAGPPRYKLALLTWVAAYPVITLILGLLGPELATWPLGLRTLVVSVLMVATLTWLVMPGLTRLLRPWLRPAAP